MNNSALELSESDLRKISGLVYARSGIALRETKRALVAARLQKRIREGKYASFADYLTHVEFDRSGVELTAMLDAITTNHTEFFRERAHFQFLTDRVIPSLVANPSGR